MTKTAENGVCPPHHWEITTVRIDNTAYYHHRCVRCEAQKDVPAFAPAGPTPWRLSGKGKRTE